MQSPDAECGAGLLGCLAGQETQTEESLGHILSAPFNRCDGTSALKDFWTEIVFY